jgi:hypothetical protein
LTDEGGITPLIRPFGAPSPQGEGLVNNNLSSLFLFVVFYDKIGQKEANL